MASIGFAALLAAWLVLVAGLTLLGRRAIRRGARGRRRPRR